LASPKDIKRNRKGSFAVWGTPRNSTWITFQYSLFSTEPQGEDANEKVFIDASHVTSQEKEGNEISAITPEIAVKF
jgi:hypothetical protein